MGHPTNAGSQFIKEAIEAGLTAASISGVAVRQGTVDEDTAAPFISFDLVAAPSRLVGGAEVGYVEATYQVCAHQRADGATSPTLAALADAIDDGITEAPTDTIGGWQIDSWRAEADLIDDDALVAGVLWLRRGGRYKLLIQAA